MKLVLRFRLHPAELEEPKRIQIQFRDDQGKKLMELGGTMTTPVREAGRPAGQMASTDLILGINGLWLETPGSYEFVILVNGELKASVPLKAVQR